MSQTATAAGEATATATTEATTDWRQKWSERKQNLRERRTGSLRRFVKSQVEPTERRASKKQVRKHGTKALAESMKITDPTLIQYLDQLVTSGQARSPDELYRKMEEKKQELLRLQEAKLNATEPIRPPEVPASADLTTQPIPTLPGARFTRHSQSTTSGKK